MLLDAYSTNVTNKYLNSHAESMDKIVRKIDRLPKRIELALAKLFALQVK
jgi:hypothetical protein